MSRARQDATPPSGIYIAIRNILGRFKDVYQTMRAIKPLKTIKVREVLYATPARDCSSIGLDFAFVKNYFQLR